MTENERNIIVIKKIQYIHIENYEKLMANNKKKLGMKFASFFSLSLLFSVLSCISYIYYNLVRVRIIIKQKCGNIMHIQSKSK